MACRAPDRILCLLFVVLLLLIAYAIWDKRGSSKKATEESNERLLRLAEFTRESLHSLGILEENSPADGGAATLGTDACADFVHAQMQESESIWRNSKRKRLDSLRTLGPFFLQHPWAVHPSYVVIWDFFTPSYSCPRPVERIGRLGDGGKWVCGFRQLEQRKEPCVVYSYGVNQEVSFESEILERTKCLVWMYDHTINTTRGAAVDLVKKWPEKAFLALLGLGETDTKNLHTLATEMRKNGHDFIDILKIDIEGGEFKTVPSILASFKGPLPFGQLQVEIHMNEVEPEADLLLEFGKWIETLENAGLRAFYSEPNQIPMIWGSGHIAYSEYAFLNTKLEAGYWCGTK